MSDPHPDRHEARKRLEELRARSSRRLRPTLARPSQLFEYGDDAPGIVSAVRLAQYLAGPEAKLKVEEILASTWHKYGGWDAAESGLLNMTGLQADAILLHLAQIATQEAGGAE
jgi:hypothetical protein